MLAFALACFGLLITPGPGVLSVAGVASGFGFAAGNRYLWGLCLGNALVGLMVVTGLAALVLSIPLMRPVLLVLSIGYLLYLAARVALSGTKTGFAEALSAPGFRDGLTLQFVNPKAYVVNTALFSGFPFHGIGFTETVLLKFIIFNMFWVPVHFGWLGLGLWLKQLSLSPAKQNAINWFMAISLVVVVLLAAWPEIRLIWR